jgi:hypothetical protein
MSWPKDLYIHPFLSEFVQNPQQRFGTQDILY